MAKHGNYPKMIYRTKKGKEEESMVVNDPYSHMDLIKKGWSGPAEFEDGISELEASIEKDRMVLAEKESRLAEMKKAAEGGKTKE